MFVCVVISAGSVIGALVVVERSVSVFIPDVVGLFVVLSTSGSVLLSMSGAGSGKGFAVTSGKVVETVVIIMGKMVERT